MNGFKFSGIHAGIKKNQLKDLGIIYSEKPCAAAALFTRNQVIAAPVILGREKIQSARCQAVLVNSGNANCFTGSQGIEDAETCSELTANALAISNDLVMVSSTGVIGAPLPMECFKTGIPKAVKALSQNGIEDFAQAILTTDTTQKVVSKTIDSPEGSYSITGIAKGSGMIRPDMATMLAYVLTDADMDSSLLAELLAKANQTSFNRITVDGDTSTNDTLLALANGESKIRIENEKDIQTFLNALKSVCLQLAKQIVLDGEGATKLVEIKVTGARTDADAYAVCESIAHSNLVKTALYGEDPNWGRITAAAGRSGADVDMNQMDLYFNSEPLVRHGSWLGPEAEKKTAQIMKDKEILIQLDLNLGSCTDHYFFCDFSEDYVKINADYRT